MQWMADGFNAFTVTDHQRNPLKELIVLWITCALSEISEEMIASTFLKCIQNTIFNANFAKRHPVVASLFYLKCNLKIGVRITH